MTLTTTADRWIFSRLSAVTREVGELYEGYEFDDVARLLYRFVWNELCDWYLEIAKIRLYSDDPAERLEVSGNLLVLLERVMILLHPLMPFITEEIYGFLPGAATVDRSASIFDAAFPEVDETWNDPAAEAVMEAFTAVVSGIRSAREELGIARDVVGSVTLVELDAGPTDALMALAGAFRQLSGCGVERVAKASETLTGRYAAIEGPGVKALLDLEGLVDFERERDRLLSKARKAQAEADKAGNKLRNEGFLAKAPEAVVAEERDKLAAAQSVLEEVRRQYRQRVGEEMPSMQGGRR